MTHRVHRPAWRPLPRKASPRHVRSDRLYPRSEIDGAETLYRRLSVKQCRIWSGAGMDLLLIKPAFGSYCIFIILAQTVPKKTIAEN